MRLRSKPKPSAVRAFREDMAPQLILLMGLPASGKSTFVKKKLQRFYNHRMPHLSAFKVLNSDTQLRQMQYQRAQRDYEFLRTIGPGAWGQEVAKLRYTSNQGTEVEFRLTHQEFQQLQGVKQFWAALYRPYYASYFGDRARAKQLTDDLYDKKIGKGDVVILDSTGVNVPQFLALFRRAKPMGYTTSVVWLDIDPQHCIARDKYRGETEGRSVGEAVILSYVPKIRSAYTQYSTDDLVDRFLHFKWQGDVINGEYKLVQDIKRYPRRHDQAQEPTREAAMKLKIKAAPEFDPLTLESFGFKPMGQGIWTKHLGGQDDLQVTVDTEGKSHHVRHGIAVKLPGYTNDDDMWVTLTKGYEKALSEPGKWCTIPRWNDIIKALSRYGKLQGDVDVQARFRARRAVIATLIKAGRPDLANQYAGVEVTAEGNIEDDTPTMALAICNVVIDDIMEFFYLRLSSPDKVKPEDKRLGQEVNKLRGSRGKLVDQMTGFANQLYRKDPGFKKQIRAQGNRGRAQLYVRMRHWLSAELKRHYPVIFGQLPQDFLIDRPLPKVHAGAWAHEARANPRDSIEWCTVFTRLDRTYGVGLGAGGQHAKLAPQFKQDPEVQRLITTHFKTFDQAHDAAQRVFRHAKVAQGSTEPRRGAVAGTSDVVITIVPGPGKDPMVRIAASHPGQTIELREFKQMVDSIKGYRDEIAKALVQRWALGYGKDPQMDRNFEVSSDVKVHEGNPEEVKNILKGLPKSRQHVKSSRSADQALADYMASGELKALVAANHNLVKLHGLVDRSINELADELQTPIGPDNRRRVKRTLEEARRHVEKNQSELAGIHSHLESLLALKDINACTVAARQGDDGTIAQTVLRKRPKALKKMFEDLVQAKGLSFGSEETYDEMNEGHALVWFGLAKYERYGSDERFSIVPTGKPWSSIPGQP